MRIATTVLTRSILLVALAIPSPTAAQEKVEADLRSLGDKLKAAVKNGELTESEAMAKYQAAVAAAKAAGQDRTAGSGKSKAEARAASLLGIAASLNAAVMSGKLTQDQAIARFGAALAAAETGLDKQGMAGKGTMQGGTFYAIFIGRLKSKDVELGEFELDVDHITSIYGDRSRKNQLVGKTVKVVGVSGPWLDKLLLIKKGETVKLRSMTLNATTVSLSSKATVLERAAPFSAATYPIPPESFRGFRGVITGKIVSKSDQGYELIMRVSSVEEAFAASTAADPKTIEGRLLEVRGFYDQEFRSKFDDLRIGDTIRLGAAHSDRTVDSLEVFRALQKVDSR